MFGEDASESPRQPSPWHMLSASSSNSPSPLSLATTPSPPSTPSHANDQDIRLHRESKDLSQHGQSQLQLAQTALTSNSNDGSAQVATPAATAAATDFVDDTTPLQVCDLADDFDGIGMIDPETDTTGHIEYKLKLPTPNTPYRLAKLITQLKWRLVEGGGSALYELGVMDNGLLVGLPLDEMQQSLDTLGRMLAGLGGGQVKVLRVIRVGGGERQIEQGHDDDKSEGESEDRERIQQGNNSVNKAVKTKLRTRRRSSATALFKTFSVEPVTDPTLYNVDTYNEGTSVGQEAGSSHHLDESTTVFRPTHPVAPIPNLVSKDHVVNQSHIDHQQHMSHMIQHDRTPEERAMLRRQKRDARRARRKHAHAHYKTDLTKSSNNNSNATDNVNINKTFHDSRIDFGSMSVQAVKADGQVVTVGPSSGGGAGSGGRRNNSSSSGTSTPSFETETINQLKLTTGKKQLCARTLAKLTGCENPFKPSLIVGKQGGQERFVVEALVTKRSKTIVSTTNSNDNDLVKTSSFVPIRDETRSRRSSDEINSSNDNSSMTTSLATDSDESPTVATTSDEDDLEGWGYLDFALPKLKRGSHVDDAAVQLADWVQGVSLTA
ncbi:hypothetical protein OIO90_000236 [Microbotryomycetes sp. JL221]|nr:hypothetical protein OIO90_000236 [Microbotryomycetes sp. JL221]